MSVQHTWVGSKMPGKAWRGTTQPKLIIHTLEFLGWPSPSRWDSPTHYVLNPWTQELRQYVHLARSAYALRENSLEDDYPTIQVELWGKAREVPNYDDTWYEGTAAGIQWIREQVAKVLGVAIPLVFADFDFEIPGSASSTAPQRMTDDAVRAFAGIMGHCHFGRDVDEHWDPGNLNVSRVLQYMTTGDDDVLIQDTLKKMTMEWYETLQDKTGSPGGNASYWGVDYPNQGPSQDEWDAATPELFGAAMRAGILGPFPGGSAVDSVARSTAVAAVESAGSAHERLNGISLEVPS